MLLARPVEVGSSRLTRAARLSATFAQDSVPLGESPSPGGPDRSLKGGTEVVADRSRRRDGAVERVRHKWCSARSGPHATSAPLPHLCEM